MPIMFTDHQEPGAIPNGTIIEKAIFEIGDATPVGAKGKVLGSIGNPDKENYPNVQFFYFIEWIWMSGIPVGVSDYKIREV